MAKNVTLGPYGTLNNASIIATLNSNNTLIENALLDCLSISGEQPNAMLSNLDMNGHNIVNLPAPATANSPARLVDVVNNSIYSSLVNAVNDGAAASAGVAIGQLYRNGSVVMVRVT